MSENTNQQNTYDNDGQGGMGNAGPQGIYLGTDMSKREIVDMIRSEYKVLMIGIDKNNKINILFQNIDEEERFKKEYSKSLYFINILTKGSINACWIPLSDEFLKRFNLDGNNEYSSH